MVESAFAKASARFLRSFSERELRRAYSCEYLPGFNSEGRGRKGGDMAKNVIVYSTSTCPFCIRAKQYLKENNIQFTGYDVGSNPDKADEMIKKSGQMGVPVIEIDGKIVVGFDKSKIGELLGL